MSHRKSAETKALEIVEFLKLYISKYGYPPSYREIGKAVDIKSTNSVKNYMDMLEQKNIIKKDLLKNRSIQFVDKNIIQEDKNLLSVPLIGRVTAGIPILAQEDITDTYTISRNLFNYHEQLFLLEVSGNSMIDADIHNGDYVVVKQQDDANNGDIVVALIDDSATVKTFYKETDHIRLQPQNTSYAPILLNDVKILGIVVGIIRKFRR